MPSSSFPPSIGRYKVLKRLGSGAMGEVFEVEDGDLGRRVALKLLSAEMATSPTSRERFRREAKAMAQIRHPHVLQVYELGLMGDQPFFTMELVEGGDCANYIEQGAVLPVVELARLSQQSSLGLAAAAKHNLVHRDVKPANLLLHESQVKVSDFGIVRHVESSGGLTQYGIVVGTPEYMAPEQAMGLPVDIRADIYALGISLFQLATNVLPFSGEAGSVLQMQVDKPLPDPREYRKDLPEAFVRLLRKMTAKDPAQRFQTYEELGTSLLPFMGTAPGVVFRERPGGLVFADGALEGARVDLHQGEFVVGRQPDCNLVLDDAQASRRHALFLLDDAGLLVRDLGSRNGVLINGVQVTSGRLRINDIVTIGATNFRVIGERAPAAAAGGPGPALADARLLTLHRLSKALCGFDPLQETTDALGAMLTAKDQVLPVGRVMVVRYQNAKLGDVVVHQARTPEDHVEPLYSAMQAVALGRRSLSVPDAKADARFAQNTSPTAAFLCAPLVRGPDVIGVLYADSRTTAAFEPRDLTFFEVIAHTVATAISR
jgi:hypothetical protein